MPALVPQRRSSSNPFQCQPGPRRVLGLHRIWGIFVVSGLAFVLGTGTPSTVRAASGETLLESEGAAEPVDPAISKAPDLTPNGEPAPALEPRPGAVREVKCRWVVDSSEENLPAYSVKRCTDGATLDPDAESAFGVSWQAAVLRGATEFVVKRAREEVMQYFLDAAGRTVCTHNKDDFPAVCALAKLTGKSSLPSRQAFVTALREDLRLFVPRLLANKDGVSETALMSYYAWTYSAISATRALLDGRTVAEALSGIAGDVDGKATPAVAACEHGDGPSCGLVLVSLVAQVHAESSFGSVPVIDVLTPIRAIKTMCDDPELAEGLKKLATGRKTSTVCDAVAKAERIGSLDAYWEACGGIDDESKPKKDLCSLRESLGIERIVAGMQQLYAEVSATESEQTALAFGGEDAIRAKVVDISLTTLRALRSGAPAFGSVDADVLGLAESALYFADGEYARGFVALASALDESKALAGKLPSVLVDFLPLFVDLAEASTAEEVQSALSAAASPVGAWRMKTKTGVFSIGALVGVEGGFQWGTAERGSDAASLGVVETGAFLGLSVPIGVEFSLPFRTKAGGSYGLFIPVLNVGRLVDVTFPDTLDAAVSDDILSVSDADLSFRQVFSPGALLRFGLGRSPFVLAAGGYWAPAEREAVTSDGERPALNAWRVGLSLAVDVTLFPVALRRRKG